MKHPLLLSLGLALVLATPSLANDDDGTGTLFKNLIEGTGLLGKPKNTIDYKERAPLVLPPQAGVAPLPEPQKSASSQAKNWPKDPDAERARKDEENKKKYREVAKNPAKLTQEELNKNWRPPSSVPEVAAKPFENKGSFFGSAFKKDEEAKIEFKGENRTTLIQPPAGYRTPSANQPYGPVGKTDYTVEYKDQFKKQ